MDSSKHIFSADRRSQLMTELVKRKFDIVVIGGGITGAGIALDAATRGLSVALIEKSDFASGTSGRSTKLIHGGLRYLKNHEFNLVKSVGRERSIVFQNAPHLVVPEKMLLPLYEGGSYSKFKTNIGLWLYDRLASVNKKERRIMLNSKETLAKEPLLKENGILGAGFYSEYRTDDARLTLEVMKTASSQGALCLNYIRCSGVNISSEDYSQVLCTDYFGSKDFVITGKKIVNATGPWVDEIRGIEVPNGLEKQVYHSKGVHLVVPWEKLNVENAVYFDVGDGRMIFVIPRFSTTYIGTTDTPYEGNLENPLVSMNDVDYLLKAVNNMFPAVNLSAGDIVSSWSGLRPLIYEAGKKPSEMSRKDEIFVSDSGLISIAGGKLTGYRLMAKNVVDLICKQLEISQDCRTESIRLIGGEFKSTGLVSAYITNLKTRMKSYQLNVKDAEMLVRSFGKQTDIILNKTRDFKEYKLVQALAWFCLRNEQVSTLADFYIRRTGFLYFQPEKISESLEVIVPTFAAYLKWDGQRVDKERLEIISFLESINQFSDEAN